MNDLCIRRNCTPTAQRPLTKLVRALNLSTLTGQLAQLVRARRSHRRGHRFKSCIAHSRNESPTKPEFVRTGDRDGAIAQLVERFVRNEKVWGSIPHGSIKQKNPSSQDEGFFV
jgi:hypothetical protein